MATCNPSELLADAACFQCLSNKELKAVIAQLLCNISQGGGGNPGDLVFSDALISTLALGGFSSVTSISLPNATDADTGGIQIGQFGPMMPNLTSISAPSMTVISGSDFSSNNSLSIMNCPLITTINFPAVQTMAVNLVIELCDVIPSISFPSLTSVGGSMMLDSNANLQSIDLPLLTTFLGGTSGGLNASTNPNLTSFNAPNLLIPNVNNTTVTFNGDSLDQASVDQILARGVASGLNKNSIEIDLSGGTNSSPTGGNLNPDYLTLIGNTVQVFIN